MKNVKLLCVCIAIAIMSMCLGQSNLNIKKEHIITANFNVEGMLIRGGFLWMGWPTNIGKALDGLKGIEQHSFDTITKIFTVKYDSTKVKADDIKSVVEKVDKDNFTLINWEILSADSTNKSGIQNGKIFKWWTSFK